MSNDKVVNVEVKNFKDRDCFRVSVYFDYINDNHHIDFHKDTPRHRVAQLFHEMSELILKGNS